MTSPNRCFPPRLALANLIPAHLGPSRQPAPARATQPLSGLRAPGLGALLMAATLAGMPALAQAQTLTESAQAATIAPLHAASQSTPKDQTQDTAAPLPAALLADSIRINGKDQLEASGHVEVSYNGRHLSASRVIYDRKSDTLKLEGPIRIIDPNQQGSVLLADQGELSRDMQHGLLLGARMVMARELQLAAARLDRDGTRTNMEQVIASSCRVCITGEAPLWEIRARRITHDAVTRQLYFDEAQFRAMGVPVFYLPRLRLPDPTVTRMTGFLRPSIRTTSSLGTGLKLPYFIALDDHQDLLLEPYFSTSWTRTLSYRYRRAFDAGSLEIAGAFTRDDIREGKDRGYLFAKGSFALPDDFKLGIDLRLVSDDAYLLNYDISDDDRLWSGVTLERVRSDELIWAQIGNTHSIRDGESNSTEPMLAGDMVWTRVFRPNSIGGEGEISWELHGDRRSSSSSLDSDGDGISDGRDLMRATMSAHWQRNWLLKGGLLATLRTQLDADVIDVSQDPEYPDTITRALPQIGVQLRWPWLRSDAHGTQVLEPVAQLIWSPKNLTDAPNEDSLLSEFDEGNLFSDSHFTGSDVREHGLRANLGLSWTREDTAGWSLGAMVGKVFYADDLEQFPDGSAFAGSQSQWLVSTQFSTAGGLTLANRALFNDAMHLSRNELRMGLFDNRRKLAAAYIWMDSNPDEGLDEDVSELLLESAWRLNKSWTGNVNARYDFTAQRAAKASVGLTWSNECVSVDLSLSRRFTSSTSVTPETDFGLTVRLAGFGASGSDSQPARVCTR